MLYNVGDAFENDKDVNSTITVNKVRINNEKYLQPTPTMLHKKFNPTVTGKLNDVSSKR